MTDRYRRLAIVCLSAIAYFVAFPDDTGAIAATILDLTTAVPNALYGVVAVGILAAAIVKTWGCRPA